MPKINLLIEVASFDKGGLEKVVLDSALRFDPDRFDVTIVSVGKTGYLAGVAKEKGLRVYGLPLLGRTIKYRKILKDHQISLANSHFSFFGYPILRACGIPNITFIHNVYAFLTGSLLRRFTEADCYVDRYISVSRNATRYAIERLNIQPEKITTIPNGLIIEEHLRRARNAPTFSREQLGLSDKDYIFLNVASYNLHKGHYLMADALKRIVPHRRDIKIVCIGNVTDVRRFRQFQAYIKAAGLEEFMLMPGYFPNIESFYRITDAFLLPSFIEGWSIAMNEAMFYGKPMILTNTGGAAEVIENCDIGIIIENEYGDVANLDAAKLDDLAYRRREFQSGEALAAAMLQFTDNCEYWREAGKKGRDKIFIRYNYDDTVKRYEDVFLNLLSRSKP